MGWKEKAEEWLYAWRKGHEIEEGEVMKLLDILEESDTIEEFKRKAMEYIKSETLWFEDTVKSVLEVMLSEIGEG